LGGIVSLIGFLHLNRLPNIKRVIEPRECGSQFIILQEIEADNQAQAADKGEES
jgi:hypothetical protein